MERIFARN